MNYHFATKYTRRLTALFFYLLYIGGLMASPEEDFLQAWSDGDSLLAVRVDPTTLQHAERLGIVYDGVACKALIDQTLPPALHQALSHQRVNIVRRDEGNGITCLIVTEPYDSTTTTLYFRDGRWIAPAEYLTSHWSLLESRYFRFRLEDPNRFPPSAPAELDHFVETTAQCLGIDAEGLAVLSREKIDYLFCRNDATMRALTGFSAKGMFLTGEDAIVSTLPCHYHEIVHLLVNYRLGHLPLYAHSFVQEGLAVALGGRDGKSAAVIRQVGAFLLRSGTIAPGEVLAGKTFASLDASFTYPVAGWFQSYLLNQLSSDEYLKFYRKYCGTNPSVRDGLVRLPAVRTGWEDALAHTDVATIGFPDDISLAAMAEDSLAIVTATDGGVLVACAPGIVLLGASDMFSGFHSPIFEERCPGRTYRGERYLLRVDAEEIAVYDLYTGTMIAEWSAGLNATTQTPPVASGLEIFSIPAGLPGGPWTFEGGVRIPQGRTGNRE